MSTFKIVIHVWPHSTGNGADKDQLQAGEKIRTLHVEADSLEDALKMAKLYRDGIETNPMVWKAPIWMILREG